MLVKIPFQGFYESIPSLTIDDFIQSYYQDDNGNDQDVPNKAYSNYREMQLKYANVYVDKFSEKISELLEIDINLQLKEIDSPREYNFATDCLYCELSDKAWETFCSHVMPLSLQEVVTKRCTSYDGFISFYSNSLQDEDWKKAVTDLDLPQTELYFLALIEQESFTDDIEDLYRYDLNEDDNLRNDIEMLIKE